MRLIFTVAFVAFMLTGCVRPETAVAYAKRAYPECTGHSKMSHNYGGEKGSQTEVSMLCDGKRRSITVKCIHGFGIISDTTCHENN